MKIQVLDHGYVEFVEAWGGGKHGLEDYNEFESGIIEAASSCPWVTTRACGLTPTCGIGWVS